MILSLFVRWLRRESTHKPDISAGPEEQRIRSAGICDVPRIRGVVGLFIGYARKRPVKVLVCEERDRREKKVRERTWWRKGLNYHEPTSNSTQRKAYFLKMFLKGVVAYENRWTLRGKRGTYRRRTNQSGPETPTRKSPCSTASQARVPQSVP